MPYNGSGAFSRLYNFVTDRNNAINITASRMDAEIDGLATGLSTALTKTGETQPTADLPMANFKHTGVGNASARNQYAAAGQAQDGDFTWCGTAAGTADAITLTTAPVTTALKAGRRLRFVSSGANTGAVTISENGLAAKAATKNGTTALAAGDIPSGAVVQAVYDGTQYQITVVADRLPKSGGTLTGTLTMSGAAINEAAAADVASAGTTDIGAAASNSVRVTGTTTVTGFGTAAAGVRRRVRFAGALTLTHNATSLILPTGANIATAANDTLEALSLGSGNWFVERYNRADGTAVGGAQFYAGSLTRDLSLATASVAYTGVGFRPKAVLFLAAANGSVVMSAGFATAAAGGMVFSNSGGTAGNFSASTAAAVGVQVTGADAQNATLASLDADGFTLSWTKSGTPTGTVTVPYLAMR